MADVWQRLVVKTWRKLTLGVFYHPIAKSFHQIASPPQCIGRKIPKNLFKDTNHHYYLLNFCFLRFFFQNTARFHFWDRETFPRFVSRRNQFFNPTPEGINSHSLKTNGKGPGPPKRSRIIFLYPSSHNHGFFVKNGCINPISYCFLSFRVIFHWTMIMGERVTPILMGAFAVRF